MQDALSAVGVADEEFSHARPAEDPPWMASYNEARHTGFSGSALWELGMRGQFVAETRTRLSTGIAARADGRGRTGHQLQLTRLIMVTDDPMEAAALGNQALDWAGPLRSGHVVHALRDLRRLAQPHARVSEIAELRHRIGIVIAAS